MILATGGLEAVRLLLDTGLRHGRTPGDRADLLGRYSWNTCWSAVGWWSPIRGRGGCSASRSTAPGGSTAPYVSAKLTLSDEVVAADGLLATHALLVPRDAAYGARRTRPVPAAQPERPPGAAVRPDRRRRPPARRPAGSRPGNPGQPGTPTQRRPGRLAGRPPNPRYSVFELLHQTEQSPDPDHRLSLAPRLRDALGRSELELQWRWSAADRQRIARARDRYAPGAGHGGRRRP